MIDPKGDLGNLLLTFPNMSGEDFVPWANEEEARTAEGLDRRIRAFRGGKMASPPTWPA
jgi:hypothetical protein